jgi:hypothetical protein
MKISRPGLAAGAIVTMFQSSADHSRHDYLLICLIAGTGN